MPEYGLGDKSPEELEEERYKKAFLEEIRRGREAEAAAIQRGIDAENSSIQTAEILCHMTDQIQEIRNVQEIERQARNDAEKANTKFQWVNTILVALTLVVTILFGLHSCSTTPTNGTQESKVAAVSLAPDK